MRERLERVAPRAMGTTRVGRWRSAEEANDGRSNTHPRCDKSSRAGEWEAAMECEASTDAPREDQARPSEPDVAPRVVS